MTVWTPVAEFLSCQSRTVYKRVWSIATAVQFSYRFLKLFNAHNPCHHWNRRQCCLHDHSLMQDSSQCEIDWLKMCPAVKGFMETTPSRMLVGKFSLPTGRQNHDPPTKWWVEDRTSFKGNNNAFWRDDMEWSLLLLKILKILKILKCLYFQVVVTPQNVRELIDTQRPASKHVHDWYDWRCWYDWRWLVLRGVGDLLMTLQYFFLAHAETMPQVQHSTKI